VEAVLPAVAAQEDRRRSRAARHAGAEGRKLGTAGSVGTRAPAAAERTAAGAAEAHAADIAAADRGVPVGLRLACRLVESDAEIVDAVMNEDVGVRDAADRAVLVVDHGGLPSAAVPVVVAPLAVHRWEVHRLRVDELRTLDGVLRADPGARIQQ